MEMPLWSDNRAIGRPALSPRVLFELPRELCGFLLVERYPDSIGLDGVEIAAVYFRCSAEHRAGVGGNLDVFLDSGVSQVDVQVRIDRKTDWGNVRWRVPGDPYSHGICKMGHFEGRGDTADLRDVDAQEVDVAVAQQVDPLARIVKELSCSDRRRRMRLETPEPFVAFKRHDVFQEVEVVRFGRFCKADGLTWLQAFMHIVQHLKATTIAFVDVMEKLDMR